MFERVFQWTVRNGSRVLFGLAVLIFALSISNNTWSALRDSYLRGDRYIILIAGITAAMKDAFLPLIAAIAIERFRAREGHARV
ncbi:MAG: hypothetical protein JWL96_3543 [Sphingomonas bacterium]|uniref:hypothetical protein n=1 Tax=Sphingomonas bacterium TaxID=1895847 RepID=UPI002614D4E5|nr:hypothetical protein [Sphingomonas bacterium]MDB5711473.1 hypothetical protein [Sphingomonas bacterium]